jgi:hypothetical protein
LIDLYREPDIISEIIKVRLRRRGLVEGIPEEKTTKNVFKNIPEGKSSVGKPRQRWVADVQNDLMNMG